VKSQKNAWDEYCSLLLLVILALYIHWKLCSGLHLNRTRWHADRKADHASQCSRVSSEDVAVLAPYPPVTSHRPLCHFPLGPACGAALPAATGQEKDQRTKDIGLFSREQL